MLAALSAFGANAYAIWEFGGAVIAVMLTACLIMMGIALIKRLIE
jgi:hypothetical protein